jgi:hypothetical protein
MKKILTLIAVAGTCSVCHAQNYQAILTGTQEVPANNLTSTDGTYSFASFSLSGNVLSVTSAFYGNSVGAPTVITVNEQQPGFVGPQLFELNIDNDEVNNGGFVDGTYSSSAGSETYQLTGTDLAALNDGGLYVNIATAAEPNGEIRGQITAVPEPASLTLMGIGSLAWLAKRRKKA